MILADLHSHTLCSHGTGSVREMFEAGQRCGLLYHGFSEHSSRPEGYDYPREYRDRLDAAFPGYVRDVRGLIAEQAEARTGVTVLLGMEQDWIEDEPEAMLRLARAYEFDYRIGGIHFLGRWGFDADADDWAALDQEARAGMYARYYRTMRRMAESGLFHIIAHPDLIKIFTIDDFRAWLHRAGSLDLVRGALTAARNAGMAMEISSAGLRKPCREIYPGPEILCLAAELGMPVAFGSDAHSVDTVADHFPDLARYARSAGYTESLVFRGGAAFAVPF
jgi:histidinol-phosphatase (PHP family)